MLFRSPKHRLNILQVESIRYQRCAGRDSYRKIAQRYGVAYSTIQAICTGRAWRHAPGPLEDPYQPSDQGGGVTQLSLFGDNS